MRIKWHIHVINRAVILTMYVIITEIVSGVAGVSDHLHRAGRFHDM